MIKILTVNFLTILMLGAGPSFASTQPGSPIQYSFLREQNKPALESALNTTSQTLKDSGLISLETDGFGNIAIDWVDQIWVNLDYSQAMFLKYDLKPQDETLMGKVLKMGEAFLIHGRQDSGIYFTAYFNGFDEKSAKGYFQKVVHAKNRSTMNSFPNIFSIPSANAEQMTSTCGTKTTTALSGLYTAVKDNKLTCVKSFVKTAFGGVIGFIAGTVLGVMDGSIWDKVGTNWSFITSVISAINKSTGAIKDLDYLPEKTRAEFACEALGKGASTASSSISAGLSGPALTAAISQFIKQITNELYNSVQYRKIIEANKAKQETFCTKPSTAAGKPAINNGNIGHPITTPTNKTNLGI